jgi:hypothetical protein
MVSRKSAFAKELEGCEFSNMNAQGGASFRELGAITRLDLPALVSLQR